MHERHTNDKNLQKVRLLEELARPFGVSVLNEDRIYWQSIFEVSNAIDDIVDQDRNLDITPYIENMIHGESIPYLDQSNAKRFRIVYEGLSNERKARLHQASRISEFAILRYEARDIDAYIEHTLDESRLYADILKIDTESSDYNARNEFNDWLPSLGRAGYAADTVVDMKSDYKEGITQINPTLKTYRKLSIVACNEIHKCLELTPKKTSVMSTLGGLVLKKCALSLVSMVSDT